MTTIALSSLPSQRAVSLRQWFVRRGGQWLSQTADRLVAARMTEVSRRLSITHPEIAATLQQQAHDLVGQR